MIWQRPESDLLTSSQSGAEALCLTGWGELSPTNNILNEIEENLSLSCRFARTAVPEDTDYSFTRRRQWQPTPVLLPGKIPWTEEPGRLQSMGSRRVGHDWATSLSLSCTWEGNGNPLQCSCLENPRDRGACWAAIYGVAQSRTRLPQLSSSRDFPAGPVVTTARCQCGRCGFRPGIPEIPQPCSQPKDT